MTIYNRDLTANPPRRMATRRNMSEAARVRLYQSQLQKFVEREATPVKFETGEKIC